MTKRWALLGALLLCSRALFAGDVANFINLGFSPDAKYFLFGEYGVNDTSHPYAALFGVNVPKNIFVPKGVARKTYPSLASAGQDGLGALVTLYSGYLPVSRDYHIDHLRIGRDLYVRVDGEKPQKTLEFRDFLTKTKYSAELVQQHYGKGEGVSTTFKILLTITPPKGSPQHYTVGSPNYHQPQVENVRIREVILAPDKRSLVFVIEKHQRDHNGINVRFMVETVTTKM